MDNSNGGHSGMLASTIKRLLFLSPLIGFSVGLVLLLPSLLSRDGAQTCNARVSMDELQTWPVGLTDLETASTYVSIIEQKGGSFDVGSNIPKDSIIAVALEDGLESWREYPVFPLFYSEEEAVFYVRDPIRAKASGSCTSVQ